MPTLIEAIAAARERLAAAGVPDPGLDAELLARHVLGWDRARLLANLRDEAPEGFAAAYGEAIARRAQREPAAQITGVREFWGLDFEVTRDVLTPRPETELVVQATLDLWPDGFPTRTPIIVDIGTGSGCVAIALATELPNARFIASDASLAAVTLARRNAVRHGVADRIAFLHSAWVPPENDVDLIVCNPPYVPLAQRESLAPEVREYEPEIALFGGPDGLDFYRLLLSQIPGDLNEGGWLIVEVGYDQADAVRALAHPRFWEIGRSYRDLQGIERVLTFRALSTWEVGEGSEAQDEDE